MFILQSPKEKAYSIIEGKINSMQNIAIECIEEIYKAAYNEAIEDAYKIASETTEYADEIRKLKKE